MFSSELVKCSFANLGTWVWEECWQGDELIKVELCHHLPKESEMSPSPRCTLVQEGCRKDQSLELRAPLLYTPKSTPPGEIGALSM